MWEYIHSTKASTLVDDLIVDSFQHISILDISEPLFQPSLDVANVR
jgi:hypothetical protein